MSILAFTLVKTTRFGSGNTFFRNRKKGGRLSTPASPKYYTPFFAYRKLAVNVVSAVIVTVQLNERPEQVAPVHPFHVAPAPGTAVTVTEVPAVKVLPVGLLLAVPLPLVFITNLYVAGAGGATIPLKLAVTAVSALMVTMQVSAVPVHAPVQPVKVKPASGVALSVTTVP